jgi:hypothetical protein
MRDIRWFCDPDSDNESRYALGKPWVRGGYQYATNGRIAVRQPTSEPDTDDGKRRPNKTILEILKPSSCTEPWPTFRIKRMDDGTDGIDSADTEIAGRLTAGCYVLLVSLLGDVKYDPSGKPDDPLRFTADGIEGAVMPMKREE